MEQDAAEDLGPITIRRVRERKPKYDKEVVVTFDTVEARDYVKSLAPNLAKYQDQAGMRLQVPDHLQKLFRALMNLSYDLKKKNPGLKHSVKFDDYEQSLYMDVQLKKDGPWRRIGQEQALKANTMRHRKGNGPESLEGDELSTLLGTPTDDDDE